MDKNSSVIFDCDEEFRNEITKILEKFSAIPSPSGNEHRFGKYVRDKFIETDAFRLAINPSATVREVWIDRDRLHYVYVEMDKHSPYFFTAHLDRVGIYVNTIRAEETLLKGQLDDSIGIAVLLYLVCKFQLRVNILFTTVEEPLASWAQVKEVVEIHDRKMQPISIDIDVYNTIKEFENGHISLRLADAGGPFDKTLVEKMRTIAANNDIPVNNGELGWSFVETSLLASRSAANGDDRAILGANIGIPLVNYHSPDEITLWSCVLNCVKFLYYFVKNQQEGDVLYERDSKDL